MWVGKVKETEFKKNDFIFNSQRVEFISESRVENQSTPILGKLDVTHFKDGAIQTRSLANLPYSANIEDNWLKDLNMFGNGNICVTFVKNYKVTIDNVKPTACYLRFSELDSNENLIHSFQSEEMYPAEYLRNASIQSHSNGSHVLVSTFLAESDTQNLAIVSNEPPLRFELVIKTTDTATIFDTFI